MAQQVNLYDSLNLNSNASTAELRKQLQEKVEQLRAGGMQNHEGPMQEASTALAILGNEMRRSAYDERLNAAGAPSITIADLRSLAATPVPDAPQQAPAAHTQAPPTIPTDMPGSATQLGAPAQPEAPMPAAAPIQPAAPKIAQRIEPAADNATLKELWDRMSTTLPKVLTGLLGAQAIAGLWFILSALIKSLTFGSDLESDNIFAAFGNAMIAAVSIPLILAIALSGVVITALSVHFGYMVLEGKQANFFPRFAAVMIPLALSELAIATLYFTVDAPGEGAFNLFLMVLTIAAIVIAGLPEMRRWFNSEIMVAAQPDQMQQMQQMQLAESQNQQSQNQPQQ